MSKFSKKVSMAGIVALTMGFGGLFGNLANAANHREAPISALDKIADITDWYAFVAYDNPNDTVMMLGTDGLQEPSNAPNYFPFHDEILYEMRVDNNHNEIPDVIVQFFFSRLNTKNAAFGNNLYRFPESYTAAVGIASNVCIALPGIAGVNQVCEVPNPITGGQGRLGPVNQPQPPWDRHNGFVIPQPVNSLAGDYTPGPGLGLVEPQTFRVRIITEDDSAGTIAARNGAPIPRKVYDIPGHFRVVPSNAGARTYADFVNLSKAGIHTFAIPAALGGGTGKVFAGTTDDPFPVALGQSFDTINFSLVCGGGVNIPTVELSQAGNCQPNDVDGFNVNTIAVELPSRVLTRGGIPFGGNRSPVIGTYATSSRPRLKRYSDTPGAPPTFVRRNGATTSSILNLDSRPDRDFTQIARMGHPLFNELLTGTGCKNIFSQERATFDGVRGNCRGTGTNPDERAQRGLPDRYPDITSFILDPYLPRLVNALVEVNLGATPIGPISTLGSLIPGIPGGGRLIPTLGGSGLLPGLTTGRIGVLEAPNANTALNRSRCPSSDLNGRVGRQDMLVFTNYCEFNFQIAKLTGRPQKPVIGFDPVADLLRLDTTIPPTSPLLRKRMGPLDNTTFILGLSALDPAGWPNGRRVSDDVIDGVVRVSMGVLNRNFLLSPPTVIGAAPHVVNALIGDAAEGNDLMYIANLVQGTDLQGTQNVFPYVAFSQPGSNSRHIDEVEPGCVLAPGAVCPAPSGGGV